MENKFSIKEYSFKYTDYIESEFERMGYTFKDIQLIGEDLVAYLYNNPPLHKGDIIPGSGGAAKLRISSSKSNKGSRGSERLIYYLFNGNTFYFLVLYEKNVKEDLSSNEIKALNHAITRIKKYE